MKSGAPLERRQHHVAELAGLGRPLLDLAFSFTSPDW
jgi:hypothetical protein